MFYVSKVSPFIFGLGVLNLTYSLIYKNFYGIDKKFLIILIYGFICTVIIGAMYQIIPNSQGGKLRHPSLSYVVFSGLILFSLLSYMSLLTIASLILFLLVLIFGIHMITTVKNWHPVTVKFLSASLVYLFLSSLLILLSNLGLINYQVAIHTATVGTLLNAVYGVELAWIPMLTMTALNIRKATLLFYIKQISTPLFIIAFYTLDYRYIALVSLLEIGTAVAFLILLYMTVRKRKVTGGLPPVVKALLYSLILLPVGMSIGSFMAVHTEWMNIIINLHINLLVYGFATFTIFGGIFHLLPRIVWNWLYANSNPSITVSDLADEKGFSTLIKYSLFLYPLYILTDFRLNLLSLIIYLFVIFFFVRITFLKVILRGKAHGGNKKV